MASAVATPQQQQQQQPSPKFSIQKTSHAIHLFVATAFIDQFKDFTALPKIQYEHRQIFQAMKVPVPTPIRGTAYSLPANPELSVINFWPCFPSIEYDVVVSYKPATTDGNNNNNNSKAKPSFTTTVKTANTMLNNPTLIIVNSQELMENPGIMDLILSCKDDYLITMEKGIHTNPKFLEKLFWNALFILPHDDSPLCSCPNSEKRFCIDLEGRVQNPETWISGKKMKRFLAKEFELELTNDFSTLLKEAGVLHGKNKNGTWILPSFVDTLQKIARDPSAQIQLLAFVLREKSTIKDYDDDENSAKRQKSNQDDADGSSNKKQLTRVKGKVVAATFGFACGHTFHDYTMATFVQDNRSCGSLVTKLSGYILQKAGIKLWYWGMQVEYMKEYFGKYGAVEFGRNEFYEKWNKYRSIPLEKSLRDAAVDICVSINLPFANISV